MARDSPKPDEQADWSSESLLADLQDASFQYFIEVANPQNGLVRDRNRVGAPASIAATGMGLSALPIGVARSVVSREKAAEYTLRTLRFLYELPQGPEPDASGYKGFFYHFLDIDTGRRVWKCEALDDRYRNPHGGNCHRRRIFPRGQRNRGADPRVFASGSIIVSTGPGH